MNKKIISGIIGLTVMFTLTGCDLLTGPSANAQKNKQEVKKQDKEANAQKNDFKNKTNKEEAKNKIADKSVMQQDIVMDETLKKKLNTFFSNFSEANLGAFENGNISNKELIAFGIIHNYINNKGLIKKIDNNKGKVSAKYIDYSVKKYFNKVIEPHETPNNIYSYKDGYYTIPISKREEFNFSQITRLLESTDGTYIAFVNVYTVPSTFKGDVHGDVKGISEVKLQGQMKATLKKLNEEGKERYVLIDYNKIN